MTLRPQSASIYMGWFWIKCNRLAAADMVQIVTLVIGDSSMQLLFLELLIVQLESRSFSVVW